MGSTGESRAVSTYFAHLDRDLTLLPAPTAASPINRLRALLVLYSLIHERLVVFDSGVLYNPHLEALLRDRDYASFGYSGLLQDGTLVVARRDVAPTFRELERHLRMTGTYQPLPVERALDFADFLDEKVTQSIVSRQADVYRAYSSFIEAVLRDDRFTGTIGRKDTADAALAYAEDRSGSFGGLLRRSFFYEFADELEHSGESKAAERLRGLASAVGSEAYALHLELPPAHPDQYQEALQALRGTWASPSPDSPLSLSAVTDALPLDVDLLRYIDYDTVREVRASKPFRAFIQIYRSALDESDGERATKMLADGLLTYFGEIRDPLYAAATGRGADLRRARRKIVVSISLTGAGTVGLAIGGVALGSVVAPVAGAALGLAWTFSGVASEHRLRRDLRHVIDDSTKDIALSGIATRGDVKPMFPQQAD